MYLNIQPSKSKGTDTNDRGEYSAKTKVVESRVHHSCFSCTTWEYKIVLKVGRSNIHIWTCIICCCLVAKSCPTLWDACHVSLSFTISWSLLKLMSIELVMPSNCLVLCCPLLLLPSIFPSIRVFPNELPLCIKCKSIGELVHNKQRGVKIFQMKISLVVLWLRIYFPIKGTWVWSLVGK